MAYVGSNPTYKPNRMIITHYLYNGAGLLFVFIKGIPDPIVGQLMTDLVFVADTNNIFFERKGYINTWSNLKTFYGNTSYLEMRFPGAASLIRSSEVPGFHLGLDRLVDNTRTDLVYAPGRSGPGRLGFLMNHTPGYLRI